MRPARTRIKICGLTRAADASEAAAAGADALGFISHPPSPRHIDLFAAEWIRELPPLVSKVAVVVDPASAFLERLAAARLFDTVQFHGHESPETLRLAESLGLRVIKVFRPRAEEDWAAMAAFPAQALLIDTPAPDGRLGGSGLTGDWARAAAFVREAADKRVILSGGLSPRNAAEAVRAVRPWAVDVASGVEAAPGIKDHAALRAFCEAVREADRTP